MCIDIVYSYSSVVVCLQVMRPLEVVLGPGDAVVWFPGWEHETKITKGLSVSLSLHFDTLLDTLYVRTFRSVLTEKVSPLFEV